MSGKSCGISNNGERQQFMLGSNFMRRNNNNNSNQKIVNAIKQNKADMIILQKKTEHLEQSLLIQRSLEPSQNNNINKEEIEHKITTNLDLVRGEFKGQIKLLKDYITILEQKIADLENKIVKKTPLIPKKEEPKKEEPKKEEPIKDVVENPKENKVVSKTETTEKENVTLEIKEK